MPLHQPLFGHLESMTGIMSKLPSDIHGHVLPHQIRLLYRDFGSMFYINPWPIGPQMLVIADPDPAYQITLLKHVRFQCFMPWASICIL